MQNNGTYECSDFYLVAFLTAKGYEIKGTRRDGRRVIFQLIADDELTELVRTYYNRQDSVPALDLKDAIVNLKSRLHNT